MAGVTLASKACGEVADPEQRPASGRRARATHARAWASQPCWTYNPA